MLAIIGGTGLYKLDTFQQISTHDIETPYGKPTSEPITYTYEGKKIVFLPRHGGNHSVLPHEINYPANIYALKKMGITKVIAVSAVGSLRHKIKPGDFVIPYQYLDFVRGQRQKTMFGNGIAAHVSTAQPVCKKLTKLLLQTAKHVENMHIHTNKKYACIDGPRLGTHAESIFLRRSAKSDVVGMTNVPEVFLAREAQMCYSTLCIATDYDSWQKNPSKHVTLEQVMQTYRDSMNKAKQLIHKVIMNEFDKGNGKYDCTCRHSLDKAILTDIDTLDDKQRKLVELLQQ